MAYRSNYSNLKNHLTVLIDVDELCSAIVDGVFAQAQVVRQKCSHGIQSPGDYPAFPVPHFPRSCK